MNKEALRDEIRQVIRMLEDAVIVGADNYIYMLIGRLAKIQMVLDELEPPENKGWYNDEN